MRLFFWLCLCLIIPGLLIRIPFGGAGILLTDILLPLFAILWTGKKVIFQEKFPKNSFILPGFIFVGITILSWILGAWGLDIKAKILSFSYIIRIISILIFAWATLEMVGKVINSKEQIINIFLIRLFKITGIILFLGFLQFYLFPDLANISTEGGWDPHFGRFLGTWMDPNYLGGFLAFMIPLLIAQFYGRTTTKAKFWVGLLMLVSLYALFLTFSRSAYLAAAIGLFLFFVFHDRKMILIGILVMTIGILSSERSTKRVGELLGTMKSVVLQDTDEVDATASLRIQNWQKSFGLFQKYPILGIGYNTYRFRAAEEGVVDESYFSAGGADSTLLTILVTTGIVGFVSFLYFCIKILFINLFRYLARIKNLELKVRNEALIYLGFTSGFLAMFVHAFFVNSFLFPLILMPVMAVAGILEDEKENEV